MENQMKRKWLAIGIIMLFVGASLIPGISGESIIKNIPTKWFTGFREHTKVSMEKNHTMLVNISPATAYAGDGIEYDIIVSLIGGGYPDEDNLFVALYNETGACVTGIDEWCRIGDYDIADELIILSGGTFYIYAYNDTHDSQGHNATILVTKYTVASSPSVLAWKIDTDINITFQLTPLGDGTLTLFNMSHVPEAAVVGQSTQITIENGVGTINGVNATTIGNVTFGYIPDGGEERSADGLVQIKSLPFTAIFAGLITELNDTGGDTIGFNAKFVFFTILNPFEMGRVIPDEEIWVSRHYQGYLGQGFILGIFNVVSTEYP
jgi:hypothetical protein